jgi:hypothetical protein
LLKEVVVSLSSFFCFDDWPLGPGGGWGSTEALLERRVERRGCSSGAGDGDFDDRAAPRFLGALAAASTAVTAASARGGGGTSISFSSGIVSGMFFGFSFSSPAAFSGFFAGSLIVHGAKSFACIPGDTERCLVNPLLPISGIFGPSALFLFVFKFTDGLVHVLAAFCFEGGTYGAAFIVISPGGGTNFSFRSPSSFTSPSSSPSSLFASSRSSMFALIFFGGGGTNDVFFFCSFSLVHSFVVVAIRSRSIGPSYSLIPLPLSSR